MRLAQAIRMGAWLLVGLNLLISLGSIGIFTRMAPAITIVIDRNEHSLQACEEMLALLPLSNNSSDYLPTRLNDFENAFVRAKNNVTEPEEPVVLPSIENIFPSPLNGNLIARQAVVAAIGEKLRRSTGVDLSHEMQKIFIGINEILDKCQKQCLPVRLWHKREEP